MADAGNTTTLPHLGIFQPIAGLPILPAAAGDEYLHPVAPSGHYRATETSYFGFNIPEHRINGEIYIWFHPVLKVMSAGIWIYQGLKGGVLQSDYLSYYDYLPAVQDISDYTIEEIGLRIRVVEPMKVIDIELSDAEQDTSLSLRSEAIMPGALRPGGHHFTQAMKTSGVLRLRGERYAIDGFFTRDRSWGQERSERPLRIPPLSWAVGVFDAGFAFHAMGMDSADRRPDWLSRYPIGPGDNLQWGYVFREGEVRPVTALSQLTHRGAGDLIPHAIEMTLTDTSGFKLELFGTVVARQIWHAWKHSGNWFCLVRWESRHGTAWGDLQDIHYNDFVLNFGK